MKDHPASNGNRKEYKKSTLFFCGDLNSAELVRPGDMTIIESDVFDAVSSMSSLFASTSRDVRFNVTF